MTAGNARLEHQIVFDAEARDQVELLEHQPEPVAPQFRPAGIAEARRRNASPSADLAAIGRIEAGDQMQQRALAAAGFAGQRDALAGRDGRGSPRAAPRSARRRRDRSWSGPDTLSTIGLPLAMSGADGAASHAASGISARTRRPAPAAGTPRHRADLRDGAGSRLRPTSLKPAASISCAHHALLDPVQRLGDVDAVARPWRNDRRSPGSRRASAPRTSSCS